MSKKVYRVFGSYQDGKAASLTIDAISPRDAEVIANKAGILVSNVILKEETREKTPKEEPKKTKSSTYWVYGKVDAFLSGFDDRVINILGRIVLLAFAIFPVILTAGTVLVLVQWYRMASEQGAKLDSLPIAVSLGFWLLYLIAFCVFLVILYLPLSFADKNHPNRVKIFQLCTLSVLIPFLWLFAMGVALFPPRKIN